MFLFWSKLDAFMIFSFYFWSNTSDATVDGDRHYDCNNNVSLGWGVYCTIPAMMKPPHETRWWNRHKYPYNMQSTEYCIQYNIRHTHQLFIFLEAYDCISYFYTVGEGCFGWRMYRHRNTERYENIRMHKMTPSVIDLCPTVDTLHTQYWTRIDFQLRQGAFISLWAYLNMTVGHMNWLDFVCSPLHSL